MLLQPCLNEGESMEKEELYSIKFWEKEKKCIILIRDVLQI
jgi:hypothetical protein